MSVRVALRETVRAGYLQALIVSNMVLGVYHTIIIIKPYSTGLNNWNKVLGYIILEP